MKRQCGWCKKNMGEIQSVCHSENAITHGICHDCASIFFNELGYDLKIFLDTISAPIILVRETGALATANKQASNLLSKDLSEIEISRPGDVFECAYSKLPEGCGHTTHCSGCTIRRTVMDTFITGHSNLKVPAQLKKGTVDQNKNADYLISTEKVGKFVLLRIDDVR